MSEDDTTFGRQAQNESAPGHAMNESAPGNAMNESAPRQDAHEASRPNVPEGHFESFTPELPPESGGDYPLPATSAKELLGQIYNYMLDAEEETALEMLRGYISAKQTDTYADAKRDMEAHAQEQLTYFKKTHICLPATETVVDYVNTMIEKQVEDERTPENSRADVALKMISALYD